MDDSRPVLVILTADNCGHCQKLKPLLGNIKDELKKTGDKVRFVPIQQSSTRDRIDSKIYPADLNNYLVFFPMSILIPGATWNAAMKNPNHAGDLNGIVMNAVREGNSWVPASGRYSNDVAGITSWVNDNIADVRTARSSKSEIRSLTEQAYYPTVGTGIEKKVCGQLNIIPLRK